MNADAAGSSRPPVAAAQYSKRQRERRFVGDVDHAKLTRTFDKKLANTSPERAAKIILDGVRKNRARVLVGPDAKALDLVVRASHQKPFCEYGGTNVQ